MFPQALLAHEASAVRSLFDAVFCEQKTMEILSRHNRIGLFQGKGNQPEGLYRLRRHFSTQLAAAPDTDKTEKLGLHRHPPVQVAPCGSGYR